MHYPAFIIPVSEGGYAVAFPDVPEALTQGDSLEESLGMAACVLAECVDEYARAGRSLPLASSPEQLGEKLAALAREPGVDASRTALIQMIAAPDPDMRPVKLNISMTRGALAAIDAKAAACGMTRSGFLVRAALAYNG